MRAVNDLGAGEWSAASTWSRTEADVFYESVVEEQTILGGADFVSTPVYLCGLRQSPWQ